MAYLHTIDGSQHFRALLAEDLGGTTAVTSSHQDTAKDIEKTLLIGMTGIHSATNHISVTIQHGYDVDRGGTIQTIWEDVDEDKDLVGESVSQLTTAGEFEVSYIGCHRYLRVQVQADGATNAGNKILVAYVGRFRHTGLGEQS